jgi:hypothetical protein
MNQLACRGNTEVLSRIHALNLSDLAYDCISDLFQRNEAGRYVQLETYFAGFSHEHFSDAETLVHLRRLIAARISHGIFRLLNEADPSLGKILRNIKLSISALNLFEEVTRFGEAFLRPSSCDPLEHLPEATQEEMERALLDCTTNSAFVPELMAALSAYLRSQNTCRRTVSLVSVALAIRSVHTARGKILLEPAQPADMSLAYDAVVIVRMTMRELRERANRYVQMNKISSALLEQYCAVIEDGLTRRLVHANGQDFTLFGSLQQLDPTITKSRYRASHRSRLEYLARLANEIAAECMTKV